MISREILESRLNDARTENKQLRHALEMIASHYEGCDIDDDSSSLQVLRTSCRAIGWTISKDEYNQISLTKVSKLAPGTEFIVNSDRTMGPVE
jgi:hypothetical protein